MKICEVYVKLYHRLMFVLMEGLVRIETDLPYVSVHQVICILTKFSEAYSARHENS